jgi:large subunit ribosomal protein L10
MTERTVRPGKLETVKKLKEMFDSAKGLYFADFQGLNVAQATELRNKCREAGVDFMVVKNTMAQRALDESVREALGDTLTGPTAPG